MLYFLCLITIAAAELGSRAQYPQTAELLAKDQEPWFELSADSLDELKGSVVFQTVKHPELYNIFCGTDCRTSFQWFIDNHEKFNLSAYDIIQITYAQVIILRIRNKGQSSGVSVVIPMNGIPYVNEKPIGVLIGQLVGQMMVGLIGMMLMLSAMQVFFR